MRPAAKKYTTAYKKRVDVERDTYIPRRAPKETVQCTGCGAFYFRRRWTLTVPEEFKRPRRFRPVYCPACRKIKERYPSGELYLLRIDGEERRDVARILRNEEERAREKNPLERIMRLEAANGDWRIETTTEKLAQRLGRSIKKARGGTLIYKWSHNNKFVRVLWQKKTD
jgi:hypothetical protein